ncbi:MAG: hypothetical protein KGM44_02190 [bacterium]|nr:hypothetical protein [bacterium]
MEEKQTAAWPAAEGGAMFRWISTTFVTALVFVALALPASAASLSRVIVKNFSGHCLSVGVQDAGSHPMERFGWFAPNETFDHTFQVWSGEYFIEWTVATCANGKITPVFTDWYIVKVSRPTEAFQVIPRNGKYVFVNWP